MKTLTPNEKSRKIIAAGGQPITVFPNSLSDWLDPAWPIEVFCEFLDVMRVCESLMWLPLTVLGEQRQAVSLGIGDCVESLTVEEWSRYYD